MARKITIEGEEILKSLNDDWGGVNNTESTQEVYNTPIPPHAEWGVNRGEVERFQKEQLSTKIGASRIDGNDVVYFNTEEDAATWDNTHDSSLELSRMNLSGSRTDFRFIHVIEQPGTVYITGDEAYMFKLYIKSMEIDAQGEETNPHESRVTLSIRNIVNNRVTVTEIGTVETNKTIEVNISPYVVNGSVISFTATGIDATRSSAQYNVVRVRLTLGIQAGQENWWGAPYINGAAGVSWGVPLRINSNVPRCKLKVLATKDGTSYINYVETENLSEQYFLQFTHPSVNGGDSGVYKLHLELIADGEAYADIPHSILEFNIFCVTENDTEGKYFIVNDEVDVLHNYLENIVFKYAVYSAHGSHDVTLEAKVGGQDIVHPQVIPVVNNHVYPYNLGMELERNTSDDFTVNISAVLDNDVTDCYNKDFTATNEMGYSATPGAVALYKGTGRSNYEANHTKLIDIITGNMITPTWSLSMIWSSVNGWYTKTILDRAGNEVTVTVLRLLGEEFITIPIQPLAMAASEGRTLEIMFQSRNVQNYNSPIIQCWDADQGSYKGLKVTSDTISLFTTDHKDSTTQAVNYTCEDINILTIVVNPNYAEAGRSFNACMIYLNGQKQRTFVYNRDLNVASYLTIGCEDADIDIYAIRPYNKALSVKEVEQNTVNLQVSPYDKAYLKNKLNIHGQSGVDFNLVKNLCNCFIFKANDGSGRIPTYGWNKGDKIKGLFKTYWIDHEDWNREIELDIEGQGTTSMEYFRWNWKSSSKTAFSFAGRNIKKICAKKNFASSMQSHKMGGTEAYDYLARATGAVADDAPRQAIWQYPFVGFAEDGLGHLTFIGLYTIGPDKGDKGTFGFTDDSIAMEGLDNEPKGANFLVPWNADTVVPDEDNETYYICGQKAWEDSIKNAAGVTQSWVPAYNLSYMCSQLIHPWKGATIGETVYPDTEQGLIDYGQHLNDIDTSTPAGTTQYNEATLYEHWVKGTYKLYFYNPQSHQYQVSYVDGITYLNAELCDKGYKVGEEESGGQIVPILLTTTLLNNAADDDERNELFKKARVDKFHQEAGNYYDIRNSLFHLGWVEDDAATDNLSKNTYPYKYNALDPNEKIKWRQDDVDTVGPVDNVGKDKKPYCVEFDDNYSSYGLGNLSVWNGRNNQTWLLFRLAFASEYEEFMRTKYLPAKHMGSVGTAIDKVETFYKTLYYDRAQEYFGAALYNADANYTYEQAYLTNVDYPHKAIALEQSLGDHYSAEKRWYKMRSIYMMSKYLADLFAAGNTTGTFETRLGQGANYFTVTPAIYMYPSVQNGQTVIRGPRFWPGEPSLISYQFGPIYNDGDQAVRINGMNFISDLGNLYENTLTGIITINGAMLKNLKLGNHEDAGSIVSTITGLIISNAPALRNIDLGNLTTLNASIDLESIVGLRTLYANNTNLNQIVLCDGGPLTTFVVGDNIRILALKNKMLLSTLTIGGTTHIEQVTMVNCNADITNQIMTMLASIKNQLTDVSLTFGTENEPNIVTDAHIATILELSALDITKTFGGYITKTSGSIQGDVYVALYNLGITYIGDIVPTISITSDDVEISGGTANLVSGFNAAFTGVPMPDLGDTVKYSMYANGQPVTPVGDIATYNGASLNCITGELVTTAVSTGFAITINAYIEDSIAAAASVTLAIAKNAPITAFTIGGYGNIKEAGTYQYPIASLTPSDATTPIASLDVSFAEQDVPEGITVAANGTTGAVITVSQMPNAMTSLTLTIVATVQTTANTTTTVTSTKSIMIVEEYVDLGLPSGILWRSWNVGANTPTEAGQYFSWGNTFGKYASEIGGGEGQYIFSKENYELTEGYQLSGSIPIEHDAARVNLQGDARMPSGHNINELINNCTATWVSIGGVNGSLFTSNNGKSIFIPAAGAPISQVHSGTDVCCSSRGGNATYCEVLFANQSSVRLHAIGRNNGTSIRPILSPHTITINLKDENNNALRNVQLDIIIPGAPTEHVRTDANGIATFRSLKATITISSPLADLDTTEIVVVGDAIVNITATNMDFVDMGLPSGTLWAKGYLTKSGNSYIIGDPQGNGSYFSWGNIVGRDLSWVEPYDYSASNYATEGDTDAEHLDGGHSVSADISSNDAKHDAAVARLGNGWHFPTEDNFRELINECTWAFTSINNVYGFLVTGSNGNTLFFAASGYRSAETIIGRNGGMWCWTNKWVSNEMAKWAKIQQNQNPNIGNYYRYVGLTIRPVL